MRADSCAANITNGFAIALARTITYGPPRDLGLVRADSWAANIANGFAIAPPSPMAFLRADSKAANKLSGFATARSNAN